MASRKPLIVPDGSVFEDGAIGVKATLSGGDISLDLPGIRSVGIDDLSDVEAHCINQVYDTVSQFVRITGGGEVRFAFSLAGELLELSGKYVNGSIEKSGGVHFWLYRPLSPRHGFH